MQPQLGGGLLDVAGVVEVGRQRQRELLVLEQGADAGGQVAERGLRQRGQQPLRAEVVPARHTALAECRSRAAVRARGIA